MTFKTQFCKENTITMQSLVFFKLKAFHAHIAKGPNEKQFQEQDSENVHGPKNAGVKDTLSLTNKTITETEHNMSNILLI